VGWREEEERGRKKVKVFFFTCEQLLYGYFGIREQGEDPIDSKLVREGTLNRRSYVDGILNPNWYKVQTLEFFDWKSTAEHD